jgi:alanyl-tRNA synthetase
VNMEMNELFYREPYLKEFDSVVLTCEVSEQGYVITLEDTLFYPEGGGQPCDFGTLNGIEVINVQRKNDVVYHTVKEDIPVGTKVHGIIDWKRRFDHMQNHTGEHIVSGIIHKHYGYENVGFHMGDVIQIDMSGPLTWEQLMLVEQETNEVIYSNVPVEITYPTKEELEKIPYRSKKELIGKVRIVTIGDADICACCGTHVSHTGEIGLVKILSVIKHKDGVRVEMVSGNRALELLRKEHEEVQHISQALSAKVLEIDQAVDKLLVSNEQLYLQKKNMTDILLEQKINTYEEGTSFVLDFEEGIERTSLVNFADKLLKEKNIGTVAICNQERQGYSYIILSQSLNLRDYVKELNTSLNGKGGGKPEIIRGSFQANKEEIKNVLLKTFTNM